MDDLEQHGFAVLENVISAEQCDELTRLLEGVSPSQENSKAGIRDLFRRCPELINFISDEAISKLVTKRLGANAYAVRRFSSTRPRQPIGMCLGIRIR